MIKLITCDIDGTLVKDYKSPIEPEIFDMIEKFYQKGVLFFATSGRQLFNLKQIFEPVSDKIGYIAENGAIISYNDKILHKSKMNLDLVISLSNKILEKDGMELFICGENTTFVMPKREDFKNLIGNEVQNRVTYIKSFDEIDEDILKISFFYEGGITNELISCFEKDFGDKFNHTTSGHMWYDFMNLDTHKGNAIKIVQDLLNITKDETAAFGDNFNDIEMLSDAKYSYAMEEAHENVKKVANYTCTSVLETLKKLYNDFFGEV